MPEDPWEAAVGTVPACALQAGTAAGKHSAVAEKRVGAAQKSGGASVLSTPDEEEKETFLQVELVVQGRTSLQKVPRDWTLVQLLTLIDLEKEDSSWWSGWRGVEKHDKLVDLAEGNLVRIEGQIRCRGGGETDEMDSDQSLHDLESEPSPLDLPDNPDDHNPEEILKLRKQGWEIESVFEGTEGSESDRAEDDSPPAAPASCGPGTLVMTPEAKHFALGALDYLVSEVAEIAGNSATFQNKRRIEPHNVLLAIRCDEEINGLFGDRSIKVDGVKKESHADIRDGLRKRFKASFVRLSAEKGLSPNEAAVLAVLEWHEWSKKTQITEIGDDDLVGGYSPAADSDFSDYSPVFTGTPSASSSTANSRTATTQKATTEPA